MIAKILDFTFAGYGLVCDRAFLKIIFHYVRYLFVRFRNWLIKCYRTPYLRDVYSRIAAKLTEFMNLEENEKWYLRGR
jgi:hypothetical protein